MAGVIEKVSTLFGGHPDLVNGFNMFLPFNQDDEPTSVTEDMVLIPLEVIAQLNIHVPFASHLKGIEFGDILSTPGSTSPYSDVPTESGKNFSVLEFALHASYVYAADNKFRGDNRSVFLDFLDVWGDFRYKKCVICFSFSVGAFYIFLQN